VNELVKGLVSFIPKTGLIISDNEIEELRKQKEEKLRKQKEEKLRKQKEEKLRKQKEEEPKKQRDDDYSFTFRTLFELNAIDYKLGNNYSLGVLYQNQSLTISDEREISEIANYYGLYSVYNLNNCYFCDSFNITGVIGSGTLNYETKDKSLYKYNINSYLILMGYQWYFDIDLSLTLLGGIIFRDYKENGKDLNTNNSNDEEYIKVFVDEQKIAFFPVFLIGYSF